MRAHVTRESQLKGMKAKEKEKEKEAESLSRAAMFGDMQEGEPGMALG
jgi:hypothetical protein